MYALCCYATYDVQPFKCTNLEDGSCEMYKKMCLKKPICKAHFFIRVFVTGEIALGILNLNSNLNQISYHYGYVFVTMNCTFIYILPVKCNVKI